MATDLRALPAFFNTDTDFRNWIIGLQAQFTAIGLVQTADTGQVNTSTVVKPSVITTAQGYDVWRFADALQATLPVFIKIEYGSGSAVDRPSLWFTVGTATNGAGTITGQVGTRKQCTGSGSKTAGATLNSYCSGSTSRLTLVTSVDPSSTAFTFAAVIERPKNSSGVDQSACIFTEFYSGTINAWTNQIIPPVGSIPGVVTFGPFPTIPIGQSVVGTAVALMPGLIVWGAIFFQSTLMYIHGDIGELVTFSCTMFGTAQTYMPMGDCMALSAPNMVGQNSSAIAIPWN